MIRRIFMFVTASKFLASFRTLNFLFYVLKPLRRTFKLARIRNSCYQRQQCGIISLGGLHKFNMNYNFLSHTKNNYSRLSLIVLRVPINRYQNSNFSYT